MVTEGRMQDAGSPWTSGSIRASDAEREDVITALQQHYVDGRITEDELTERVEYLVKARTRDALGEVTRDLPPLSKPDPVQPPHGHAARGRHSPLRTVASVLAIVALLTMMFLLPAFLFFGGPPGVWGGPRFPPLLAIFLVFITLRLATRSRWR